MSAAADGAPELWLEVRFRNDRVHARCRADGQLIAGPQGFVDFVYKPGGKRYKSRPESFEAIAGVTPREHEGTEAPLLARVGEPAASSSATAPQAAAKASASGVSAPAKATSRVAKSAAKKGHAKVVDLAQRRGPDHAVQLWTDGACSGNPGPAGAGVLFEYRGVTRERSEWLGSATNNIAELTAILRGLEMVDDASLPVDVMTDSEYCIGLLGLGWKPKKNQELVEALRAEYARFADVLLVKVKGHAGVPGNERADELAREAISSRRTTST